MTSTEAYVAVAVAMAIGNAVAVRDVFREWHLMAAEVEREDDYHRVFGTDQLKPFVVCLFAFCGCFLVLGRFLLWAWRILRDRRR